MILHIFRTKVMNRGLNSKRLVKKIKKMARLFHLKKRDFSKNFSIL